LTTSLLTKCRSITSFFKAPPATKNGTAKTSAPAPIKFDKAAWVAKLTPEQKELLQLEIDTMDESWIYHLKDELVSSEFLNLKRFLKKEWASGKKIFPPKEDIYSWYDHTLACIQQPLNNFFPTGPDTRP
jgi:uracil-DNA glycosylase